MSYILILLLALLAWLIFTLWFDDDDGPHS